MPNTSCPGSRRITAMVLVCLLSLLLPASPARAQLSFTNSTGVTFNNPVPPEIANPYPSLITVSGLATIFKVTLTLKDLSHTYPSDLAILLVNPQDKGAFVMYEVGRDAPIANANLTFDDAAPGTLTAIDPIFSGTYRPSVGNPPTITFTPPAPADPYSMDFSVFSGTDPNGIWKLYIIDESAGDGGTLGAWSLNFTPVPEPSVYALAALGLGACIFLRRRSAIGA